MNAPTEGQLALAGALARGGSRGEGAIAHVTASVYTSAERFAAERALLLLQRWLTSSLSMMLSKSSDVRCWARRGRIVAWICEYLAPTIYSAASKAPISG